MNRLSRLTWAGEKPVALEVKHLTVYYDAVLALNNISLQVKEGQIVALIGPNGAGKSTTLKAICGLLTPHAGEILFQGENVNNLQPYQLVSKGLCLVPEGRRVFTTMTVLENLEMGAYIRKDKTKTVKELEKVFHLFPRLKERQKQKAGTLSSGEQQMLAIGRALMLKPKLLLLDEPSIGLSPNFIEDVFKKLKEINDSGTTILLVEQNARIALDYADRAYVFDIGKIILDGPTELLIKDDRIQKTYLGG